MTNLQNLVQSTQASNQLSSFVFQNIDELTDSVLAYQVRDGPKHDREHVIKTREHLSNFVKKYYDKIWALIPGSISREISTARDSLANSDSAALIVSAHQPNLFPYSGVLRKIALMQSIAARMRQKSGTSAVTLFAIADHDFAHNKWVRSAELPSALRKDGVLRFNVRLSQQQDYMLPANKVPKPSDQILKSWKDQIIRWIAENSSLAEKFQNSRGSNTGKGRLSLICRSQFDDFWNLVTTAYGQASNLAEFNSFTLSLIATSLWEQPLLFVNFSDLFTVLGGEYLWLMQNCEQYMDCVNTSERNLIKMGFDSGLSQDASEVFPLWLKCSCGSKYKLYKSDDDSLLGRCVRCQKEITYSKEGIWNLIEGKPDLFEPRSISMPICLSRAIAMSCYVGGIGSLGYLIHSKSASSQLHSPFPPCPFWYVRDLYESIEKLATRWEVSRIAEAYETHLSTEFSQDLKKECQIVLDKLKQKLVAGEIKQRPVAERDQQFLERVPGTLEINPCVIDYAVNIGLLPTWRQWSLFLTRDGRLNEPVRLRSAFEANSD